MPLYKYKCEPCGFDIEMIRPIKDRDNLTEIIENNCPRFKGLTIGVTVDNPKPTPAGCINFTISCELKRVPTSGSFKI